MAMTKVTELPASPPFSFRADEKRSSAALPQPHFNDVPLRYVLFGETAAALHLSIFDQPYAYGVKL